MVNASKASRGARWAAFGFIVLMLGLLLWAGLHWQKVVQSIGRDPMALLPLEQRVRDEQDEGLIERAMAQQSEFTSNKLIFMVHGETPEQTLTAVTQLKAAWAVADSPLRENPLQSQALQQAFVQFYVPHQQHILTAEQKNKFQSFNPQQWADEVLSNASRPVSLGLSVAQDPLGNLQNWLLQQMGKSPLQKTPEGDSQIELDGQPYTVLFYEAVDGGFSLNTERSVLTAYQTAKNQVLAHNPKVRILAAGIPLHAAAAAEQASYEMSFFGTISSVAIVLLVAAGFMRFRAVFLVGMSLLCGFMCAYLATYAWFGQVHVVTLVFGTSLIGVAEDYALHYLSSRTYAPEQTAWQVRRHVMAGLLLALLTTVVAYACLGLPPFPGLRQIAVFSVTGLLASWLVVVLLFPFWSDGLPHNTRLSRLFANAWLWWLRLPNWGWAGRLAVLIVCLPLVLGWSRLTVQDDLRMLQNSPQWLVQEQRLIGTALNESNTQFVLVTGQSEQALLEREERVRDVLDEQVAQQHLGGYRAVSEWLPSIKTQQANEALVLPRLAQVSPMIGLQPDAATLQSGDFLTPQQWLAQPMAQVTRAQWLGQQPDGRWASVVSLHGILDAAALQQFKLLEQQDAQVLFINSVADYSELMSTYRNKIMGLLVLAYVGTLAVLWVRYRRQALLIVLPPLLASLVTLGVCGLLGVAVQLFTVLPLLLILGMGVDYGIFLVEHADEQAHTWMTICLSAISTVLSLGLLMFSSTPALHVLGLSLGVGMAAAWLIAAVMGRYVYQRQQQREK
ncbi:MAG: MMPL family transporter [Formosimonas sp.]